MRSTRNVPHHVSDALGAAGDHARPRTSCARAADILNAGKKIVHPGRPRRARRAAPSWRQLAERLAAPVAEALLGKGVLPDDSPYATGGVGLLGTRPSQEAMESCDTLLIVGSSFPYIEFYPKPGQARVVQIDLDPPRIGLRYPVEAALVGDARRCCARCCRCSTRKADRSFLEAAQAGWPNGVRADWRSRDARATRR